PATADCTLEIAERDFIDMTTGKSDPMKLFTTGKLKISGNVMASQKLSFLQKIDPAQAIEAVAKARAAGGGPKAAAAPVAEKAAKAPAVFAALDKRLAERPVLKEEVRAVVRFVVKEPALEKVYDLAGVAGAPSTTLTLSDDDLGALAGGQTTARELFQRGKLRIDG